MEISAEEAKTIGKEIYFNECSSKKERLVWWNEGENFASLGIGHFIWYPKNERGPFDETFPEVIAFLKENNVQIPKWLKDAACPWNAKKELVEDKIKKAELQVLLEQTMDLQASFIAQRFEVSLLKILASMQTDEKRKIIKRVLALQQSSRGKFALIDYLNFKGDGTCASERYEGKGWGLKQVLEEMPENADPLFSFVATAKQVLCRRVQLAPAERKEERWLKGWLSRIDRYRAKS